MEPERKVGTIGTFFNDCLPFTFLYSTHFIIVQTLAVLLVFLNGPVPLPLQELELLALKAASNPLHLDWRKWLQMGSGEKGRFLGLQACEWNK